MLLDSNQEWRGLKIETVLIKCKYCAKIRSYNNYNSIGEELIKPQFKMILANVLFFFILFPYSKF